MVDLTARAAGGRPVERAAIVHVRALNEAKQFQELLCDQLPCPDGVIMAELSAGLSVHAGAGLVGVAVVGAPAP